MRLLGRRPSLCLFCTFQSPALLRSHSVNGSLIARGDILASSRGYRPDLREHHVDEPIFEAARVRGSFRLNLRNPPPRSSQRNPRKDSHGINYYRLDLTPRHLQNTLSAVEEELSEPAFLSSLELDAGTFSSIWSKFEKHILSLPTASKGDHKAEWDALQTLYKNGAKKALSERLKYAFYGHMVGSKFTKVELSNQKKLADLRYPPEWFPKTRQIKRTIHLHVGPTNSGKTYHALQRLEQAESGVYAGPLRLLAHEVYTRLNAKGKACGLVTGEERRYPGMAPDGQFFMWSCTVEMTPLNNPIDVAVIDEIQMINSYDRGWAWTQAFLGVCAKEVHLCGEERAVPLIKELTAAIGDTLVVHTYKRLSPLEMMDKSLRGDLKQLQKGDCVVSFSVMGIHALRKQIEQQTGKKVAIIYGSLPPETRAQQAKLFNDPDNDFDYLVASDAVGMGLNLSIKRVIFESATKHNGVSQVPLKVSEVKQIGGRAGRYKTAHQATKEDEALREKTDGFSENLDPDEVSIQNQTELQGAEPRSQESQTQQTVGYVTTLEQFDYPAVQYAMHAKAEPIKTAGIFPPSQIIEKFSSYFPPGTPFGYVLLRLNEISRIHPRYHLCALKDALQIAEAIQSVKDLTVADRIILCSAPCSMRDPAQRAFIQEFAMRIAQQRTASLLDVKQFNLDLIDAPPTSNRSYLAQLESLHKGLVLYLWLSFRFPGVFTTRALANHTKTLVEDAIELTLAKFSFTKKERDDFVAKRQQQVLEHLKDQYRGDGLVEANLVEDSVAQDQQEEQDVSVLDGQEDSVQEGQDDVVLQEQKYLVEEQEAVLRDNKDLQQVEVDNAVEDSEPPDVKEIIMDESSFKEDESTPRDDYGEYSSPEIASIEQNHSSPELDSGKQHQHSHASQAP